MKYSVKYNFVSFISTRNTFLAMKVHGYVNNLKAKYECRKIDVFFQILEITTVQ